ncbi:MAG: hypothetical protein KF833_03365 [Verrucomicrobiae bacterium]|nr:hypothetical protein [Verrucomicrobiae bacterium]
MIPSPEALRRAGEILREIEELQQEMASLFGGATKPAAAPAKRRGRPPGSGRAAARASAASGAASAGSSSGKSRRQMSPEGRARIAAAARARWARYNAAKKKKQGSE